MKTPAWPFAEDSTKTAFESFAQALAPRCAILDLPEDFERALGFHRTVMLSEMALNYASYYARGKDRLSTAIQEAVETGREMLAVDYAEALRARAHLYRLLLDRLEPYDAIITPSAPGPAPKASRPPATRSSARFGPILACPP